MPLPPVPKSDAPWTLQRSAPPKHATGNPQAVSSPRATGVVRGSERSIQSLTRAVATRGGKSHGTLGTVPSRSWTSCSRSCKSCAGRSAKPRRTRRPGPRSNSCRPRTAASSSSWTPRACRVGCGSSWCRRWLLPSAACAQIRGAMWLDDCVYQRHRERMLALSGGVQATARMHDSRTLPAQMCMKTELKDL